MTLKEKFAQKMLEEKLDFLPLEESIELYKSGVKVKTKFWWVMNVEEIENGHDLDTEDLLREYNEVFGLDNDYALTIGDEEKFDEFTLELCPAPTYIDLIK